jgi:hypothetical protein
MNCTQFRAAFAPGTDDAATLEHVRSCDACLDFAAGIDPDVMFRAIGGEDLVPPGGVEAFVGDVMREVRLRSTETAVTHHRGWSGRMAIAAALSVVITGASMFMSRESRPTMPMAVTRASLQPTITVGASTRPVVESYESQNATIVEVPTEGAGDVKVVMIFDESLPADL